MDIGVDPREIRRLLTAIVGERNPYASARHLAEVEDLVEREFARCGLKVESDYFCYRGRRFRNIIGRMPQNRGDSLLIIGAHLDSVQGTPGADDNASGLAVLLETARLLAGARTRHQPVFCAFNLEELDMVGSTYFARKLRRANTKVAGMISIEMVRYTDSRPGSQKYPTGLSWMYPDRGDFIGVIGNWNSNSLLRSVARRMHRVSRLPVETLSVPGNGGLVPAVRLSDHSPFWDVGYPAVMITDTSFYRNPNYHGATDTLESLDLAFMAKVCEGIVRAALAL